MRDSNVRRVQIVFLLIFGFSAAQVLWWVYDQSAYAEAVHHRWRTLYEADVVAALALLDRGARSESIEELFPHVAVGGLQRVEIAPDALAELDEERRAHINQYAWEGTFFLAVILAGMVVIVRAVRRDAQLRRWQSNFLAAASHELKSPLASLQLAAETLDLREHDAAHRRELVGRILADAERLGATVSKVLDADRLERGAVRVERRTIALAEAVAEALAEQDFRARSAEVELAADVPEDLEIEADPVHVQTVLRNLLDNALKATSRDATSAGGRITLRAVGDTEAVRLTVRDDGVGFPPEEAERLFERFYRVGDELRRTQTGSGLGLYLTRRFVELDGGSVTAASDGAGHGAEFTVTWPRRPSRSPAGRTSTGPTST